MTTLILVRHGETDWNAQQRFQGHADPSLNDAGRRQARELADELATAGIDAIYTSDLLRARETAEIIGTRVGLPVEPLASLREIDVGEWQGLTHTEIDERFPGKLDSWRDGETGWTQGETYDQLTERIVAALRAIAARHHDETVLVVGHGGTLRAALAHADGVTVAESRQRRAAIGNCAVWRFSAENGVIACVD